MVKQTMSVEEFHALDREIAVNRQRLDSVEKDVETIAADHKSLVSRLLIEKERYFELLLSKEAHAQWVEASFNPIQKLIWAVIGVVGMTIIVAVLSVVLKK